MSKTDDCGHEYCPVVCVDTGVAMSNVIVLFHFVISRTGMILLKLSLLSALVSENLMFVSHMSWFLFVPSSNKFVYKDNHCKCRLVLGLQP
jgi:hypothetical protein